MALAPFLRIEPGVGGLAEDLDREAQRSLAPGLEIAGGAERRLEHEDPAHPPRQRIDARERFGAADLLVGVDEEGRLDLRGEAELAQGAQGEDPLHEAALHVVGAGAEEAAVADLDRHSLDGPQRPDGVAMSDEELSPVAAAAVPAHGPELAAGLPSGKTLPWEAAGAHPGRFQLRREAGEDRLLGGGIVGRRFEPDEVAQESGHLLLAGAEVGEKGLGGGHFSAATAPSVSSPRQVSSLSSKIGRFGMRPRAALMCHPQRRAHLR